MKQFAVYIVASDRNGTIYIGMTSNLAQRIWQHKEKVVPGFTATYGCDKLVYFEMFDNAEAAITRERRLKEWKRAWKIALIEDANPIWADLYTGIAG
ncbi:MAG TPA: GIY-YIG nuclease family protein [Alphaproteobacteria bacterium]|nr:GIY-YIG nuclease family protein [Alphaproteobacteria bacterium]